jgi:hypothetical protein
MTRPLVVFAPASGRDAFVNAGKPWLRSTSTSTSAESSPNTAQESARASIVATSFHSTYAPAIHVKAQAVALSRVL